MSDTRLGAMTYDQFAALAPTGTLVPVYREVMADLLTPVSAFLRLNAPASESFLFESVEGGERVARYSFLGRDPFLVVTAVAEGLRIEDRRGGGAAHVEPGEPRALLAQLLARYRSARVPGLPRFSGGAVGFFAYDAVRWIEKLAGPPCDDQGHETMQLRFYDTLLAFDHARRLLVVIANAHIAEGAGAAGLTRAWDDAQARIGKLLDALRQPHAESDRAAERGSADGAASPRGSTATAVSAGALSPVTSNMERAGFEGMVEAALEHIRAGDIFQVVLSQRFARRTAARPFDIYRALRVINPSPYMFFLGGPGRIVLGASPEPLVRLLEGELEYRPIAGTMPRGATDAEDRANAEALLHDEKERAEHVMLVDLGRNDLGRVAVAGSVTVRDLMVVERYSHVMHLVSRLDARLAEGRGPLDVLFACLPAGTVSGAPKVRAMQLIDELEPTRRGIYAGAVGYVDFAGNLDTCIALRTMVIENGTAHVQAGAGIVADSQPAREFDETAHKARALFRAVELAEQGLD